MDENKKDLPIEITKTVEKAMNKIISMALNSQNLGLFESIDTIAELEAYLALIKNDKNNIKKPLLKFQNMVENAIEVLKLRLENQLYIVKKNHIEIIMNKWEKIINAKY